MTISTPIVLHSITFQADNFLFPSSSCDIFDKQSFDRRSDELKNAHICFWSFVFQTLWGILNLGLFGYSETL